MSNNHPTGHQGQQPFGPQGQPPFGSQGQPPFGSQGQPSSGSQGQQPYGPQGQPQFVPQGQPQLGQPPHGWAAPPPTPEQAAAQARAAKAEAKAQRSWFKKKRFVLPIGAVALITLVNVVNGGGETSATPQPGVSAPAEPVAPADDEASTESATGKAEAEKTKAAADKAAADKAAADKAAADKESAAKIGTGVQNGDFKITITKVRDGGKKVGNEYFGEEAQGHYVLVDLKVKNTGDSADYFLSSDVTLTDKKGREFSADEMASMYVSENNPLLEEVNPGNTSKGTLAFDLPKGVDAEQAQISAGGLFDGPVTVELN